MKTIIATPPAVSSAIAMGGLLILSMPFALAKDENVPLPEVWSLNEGVEAPESACFDADSGSLFLSQIGGGGGQAKDGDGWISKLTVDGKMLKNKWVTGLNAPKGLRSHDGTLWVSDIDHLVAIDIKSSRILRKIAVPEAKFLNDVACGPDGSVYVSDMLASRIYRYKDGKLETFAMGEELENPNGLLVIDGKLVVAAWGIGIQDDFSTRKPGRLLAVDLKSREVSKITQSPVGNLDGVESDGRGGYFVTDWRAGKLFHISGDGDARLLADFPQGTADLAFVIGKKLLILPEMLENKVRAFDLTGAVPE